jgi:hypothetical protein
MNAATKTIISLAAAVSRHGISVEEAALAIGRYAVACKTGRKLRWRKRFQETFGGVRVTIEVPYTREEWGKCHPRPPRGRAWREGVQP